MTDDWNAYLTEADGRPTSVVLDMGLARMAPVPGYDHSAGFRIKLQQPGQDGFPSQDESQLLAELEQAVIPMIVGDGTSIYIGSRTGNGFRDFAFYTAEPDRFRAAVAAAMTDHPVYPCRIGVKPDPQWLFYFGVLHPPPRTMQLMGNRDVLANLAQHGDRHGEPRPIDHRAVFRDRAICDAFAEFLIAQGFIVRDGSPTFANGALVLDFSRVDRPAEIDAVVLSLFDAATELGGTYDGWGCPVVT